jgi:hypothetical protein
MAIETKHTDPECNLNRSQKRAIAAMLAYPVSLIQGVSRCAESVEIACGDFAERSDHSRPVLAKLGRLLKPCSS